MRSAEAIAIILALIIVWSMYRAHRSDLFREFNLFDLIMENGRVSRLACVFMGSWLVLSYLIIRLQLDGKLTEGYYTAYAAACFAPIVAKLFTGNPPAERGN